MRFDTKVEKNDFMTAIETFTKQMQIMAQKIKNFIQSWKTKVVESFATTHLENSLVFQLDD